MTSESAGPSGPANSFHLCRFNTSGRRALAEANALDAQLVNQIPITHSP